jgi:pyrimidine operon attenuation protein / uracil phosphoribosyltransferase
MASVSSEVFLDAKGIAKTLERLAAELLASLPEGISVAVIGIRSRGEILAERLVAALGKLGLQDIQTGALDITLYRDDLAELGPKALVRSTEIDFDISGLYVVLVDDVLYTGRSVRSALDALVDLGRPKAIRLAVLVDRPGRELPIQADLVGVRVPLPDVPVAVHLTESDGVDEVLIG